MPLCSNVNDSSTFIYNIDEMSAHVNYAILEDKNSLI